MGLKEMWPENLVQNSEVAFIGVLVYRVHTSMNSHVAAEKDVLRSTTSVFTSL